MSDVVLAKQGVDPRVTDLATEIKAAQGPEIKQMQDWLEPVGQPADAAHGHGRRSRRPRHGRHVRRRDGDDVRRGDDGAERTPRASRSSRLFLTGMITHHEGAIAMAQTEIEDGKFAPAVELARAIVKTQQQEIDTMKGILETL